VGTFSHTPHSGYIGYTGDLPGSVSGSEACLGLQLSLNRGQLCWPQGVCHRRRHFLSQGRGKTLRSAYPGLPWTAVEERYGAGASGEGTGAGARSGRERAGYTSTNDVGGSWSSSSSTGLRAKLADLQCWLGLAITVPVPCPACPDWEVDVNKRTTCFRSWSFESPGWEEWDSNPRLPHSSLLTLSHFPHSRPLYEIRLSDFQRPIRQPRHTVDWWRGSEAADKVWYTRTTNNQELSRAGWKRFETTSAGTVFKNVQGFGAPKALEFSCLNNVLNSRRRV